MDNNGGDGIAGESHSIMSHRVVSLAMKVADKFVEGLPDHRAAAGKQITGSSPTGAVVSSVM